MGERRKTNDYNLFYLISSCTNNICHMEESKMNELSFHEYLLEYHDFNKHDIEHLLSSDELDELYVMYQEYLKDQQKSWVPGV